MARVAHKHHIMPRHLGGDNSEENMVRVSVAEHAEIHRCLWIYGGRWQDELAWKGLAGLIGKDDIMKEIYYRAGSSPKSPYPKSHGEKISKALSGKKLTKDHRQKLSESHKGLTSGFKGKRHLDKSLQLISKAGLGRIPWNKGLTTDDPRVAKSMAGLYKKWGRV